MKLLLIYDIHGRSEWIPSDDQINEVDKVIFGGDYFDSFDRKFDEQLFTFNKIIDIKEKYGDKIIILWGNHDIQYYYTERNLICSGYQSEHAHTINIVLTNAVRNKYLQFAWQYSNHIFTHAGVTTYVVNAINEKHPELYQMVLNKELQLADIINQTELDFYFNIERSGNHIYSGIFWIRPKYLDKARLLGYHQHVGHTYVGDIYKGYLESKWINYYDGLGITKIEI